MKILVLGGTGLIGREVTRELTALGHQVIIGTPSHGVDILTGEGLDSALEGTKVVIDLSNSHSPDEQTALAFFTKAASNLIAAEKLAGIGHHLVLSIVGTDRAQHIGYLRAKKIQEDNVIASSIPYTIIRSTQFHEHAGTIVAVQGEGDQVHVSQMDYQPIAASEVVGFMARFALEKPKNAIIEIAGPQRGPMDRFVREYLTTTGEDKTVVSNDDNRYMSFEMPKDCLVPLADFYAGKVTFERWLQQKSTI